MSFRTLCDRRIEVIPVKAGPRDAHGVQTKVLCNPIGPVRAQRNRESTGEDLANRDRRTDTYNYLIELRTIGGDKICPTGLDRIHDIDTDVTLEIIGDPELARRRRIPHHWEVRARIVTG